MTGKVPAAADRPLHVVLHCSPYDAVPSGARNRAVGLAAAFLRAGCRVAVLSPKGLELAPLVSAELGAPLPLDRWMEVPTSLDPRRPWLRAMRAAREVERATPRDADVVLTDYQPIHGGVPTAVTVHDLRYLAAPQWEGTMRTAAFRTMFPAVAERARWIVVPTRAVAGEVARLVETPAEVVVAPNGLGAVWRRAPLPEGPGKRLFVVGIGEPRKRFAWLVEVIRRARRHGPVLPVVAAGRASSATAAVLRGASDLLHEGALRWIGTPTDDELVVWTSESAALLHPSGYEGFGMTVLEALACGIPVIARPQQAVVEVGGDVVRWAGDASVVAAAHARAAAGPHVGRPSAGRLRAATMPHASAGPDDDDPGDDIGAWVHEILTASSAGAARCDEAPARRARAATFTWDRSAATLLAAFRGE